MEEIILITQDFVLHKALHHYIDGITIHKDMDKLVDYILTGNSDVKYLFIIDNRYPFSESVKVERAIMHKNINARSLVIQVSNLAHHTLGYSNYFHVRFGRDLNNIARAITSFVEGGREGSVNIFNHSIVSKVDIEILKSFIFGEDISSVANKMNVPVKKIYSYRELLYKKLGLSNFNQALLYVIKHHPGFDFNKKMLGNRDGANYEVGPWDVINFNNEM
ncbi:hypothetical protein ACWH2Z_22875 [Enterobacter mori]